MADSFTTSPASITGTTDSPPLVTQNSTNETHYLPSSSAVPSTVLPNPTATHDYLTSTSAGAFLSSAALHTLSLFPETPTLDLSLTTSATVSRSLPSTSAAFLISNATRDLSLMTSATVARSLPPTSATFLISNATTLDLSLGTSATVARSLPSTSAAASQAHPSASFPPLDLNVPPGVDLSLRLRAAAIVPNEVAAQVQPVPPHVLAIAAQVLPRPPQRVCDFPLTRITIGDWTCDTIGDRDLVGRCYFGKRHFLWEISRFIQNEQAAIHVAHRIEISFSNLRSIRVNQQTGQLDLELKIKPKFYLSNDDPTIGNKWLLINDIEEGHQTSLHRRHTVFVLPKHKRTTFAKLQADPFLAVLIGRDDYPVLHDDQFV